MQLNEGFAFKPLPEIGTPVTRPFPDINHPLGPLRDLPGTWTGKGFNTIWRPFRDPKFPKQHHFLELNLTTEKIEFEIIPGKIPNRGLLQPDMNMFGITYLQQISDAVVGAGLHIEPGIWAAVPTTLDPHEDASVVRMASIPHGTTVMAQGFSHTVSAPRIADTNITPFVIGSNPIKLIPFPETNLAVPSAFRSPPAQIAGVTQAMVDNPNSVLKAAIAGQAITRTVVLIVSSSPKAPLLGGGTDNTAFLQGGPDGPNAQAVTVESVFWIEEVKGQGGQPDFLQLQYTQTVQLNFGGLTWPHVTVATLRKAPEPQVDGGKVDPAIVH